MKGIEVIWILEMTGQVTFGSRLKRKYYAMEYLQKTIELISMMIELNGVISNSAEAIGKLNPLLSEYHKVLASLPLGSKILFKIFDLFDWLKSPFIVLKTKWRRSYGKSNRRRIS